MAGKKISQLTGATTPLTGTEQLALVQGGSTLKATAQNIADLAAGLSYTSYVALVNQTMLSAPISTVLSNDTGRTFTWSYVSAGNYNLTLSSGVNLSKIAVITGNNAYQAAPGIFQSVFFEYLPQSATPLVLPFLCSNTMTQQDDRLVNALLEIRIYP